MDVIKLSSRVREGCEDLADLYDNINVINVAPPYL